MMLWLAHRHMDESWAQTLVPRCLKSLEGLWIEDSPARGPRIATGHFARSSRERSFTLAFGNYGVAIGLQAVKAWPERVSSMLAFFEDFQSHDKYDEEAITWVMACCAHFPGLLNNSQA